MFFLVHLGCNFLSCPKKPPVCTGCGESGTVSIDHSEPCLQQSLCELVFLRSCIDWSGQNGVCWHSLKAEMALVLQSWRVVGLLKFEQRPRSRTSITFFSWVYKIKHFLKNTEVWNTCYLNTSVQRGLPQCHNLKNKPPVSATCKSTLDGAPAIQMATRKVQYCERMCIEWSQRGNISMLDHSSQCPPISHANLPKGGF